MAFKANALHQIIKAVSREKSRQPRNEPQDIQERGKGLAKELRDCLGGRRKGKKKCFLWSQVRKNFKESVSSCVKGRRLISKVM